MIKMNWRKIYKLVCSYENPHGDKTYVWLDKHTDTMIRCSSAAYWGGENKFRIMELK